MERTYYYTQQRRGDRGMAMSLTGGNDLAAPGGESQHRSTPMRRGTLISPSESPMRAQGHVLRYMGTCTGPGAARSTGPGQLARRARTSKGGQQLRARPGTR